jgi:hypothetical protein
MALRLRKLLVAHISMDPAESRDLIRLHAGSIAHLAQGYVFFGGKSIIYAVSLSLVTTRHHFVSETKRATVRCE